jgi:hypothetical protein
LRKGWGKKLKIERPRDAKGHFIKEEKKSRAGRKPGQKDSKPRAFKHPRFKKKDAVTDDPKMLTPAQTAAAVASPPIKSSVAAEPEIKLTTKPDTEFFPSGSPPKPAESDPAAQPFGDLPPLNAPKVEPEKKPDETPMNSAEADQIASMIWGAELNLCQAIFGAKMMPRKYVKEGADPAKGEVPFDESEMVRGAWKEYLISLGLIILSPLKKLWLAHAFYFVPRLGIVIGAIKNRFKKKSDQTPASPASEKAREETRSATQPGQTGQRQAEKVETPEPVVQSQTPGSNVHDTETFR